jgi:hypothetical protein
MIFDQDQKPGTKPGFSCKITNCLIILSKKPITRLTVFPEIDQKY